MGLRVVTCVCRHPPRHPAQFSLMCLQRRISSRWSAGHIGHLIMCDDLILSFLQLRQPSKLIRLARLALTNDLRVRLEQTDDLFWQLGQSCENPCLGLPHHARYAICHWSGVARTVLAPACSDAAADPPLPAASFRYPPRICRVTCSSS